jgi:uncharacterized protein
MKQNHNLIFDTFSKFKISDKKIINSYLNECTKKSADYSFVNLFCWQDAFKSMWTIYSGLLLIYYNKIDYMFMPCGKELIIDDIISISDIFVNNGRTGNYLLFDTKYVETHKADLSKYFIIKKDELNTNYIHLTERLVNLSGRKLNKKKNLVSQFQRNNPDYKVSEISKKSLLDCFKLFNKWLFEKNNPMSKEYTAFIRAYTFFEELQLNGLIITVDNVIVAFSVFSELNEETVNIHFEKYSPNIKGSAQIINYETAKYLVDKYKYINREQDLGIPGLKKSKLSYDPDILLKYYILIRKK